MALLPRTRLSPCPACAELIDTAERRCPHCAENLSGGTGFLCAAALLWSSVVLAGCSISAVYGVPTTDGWTTDDTAASSSSGDATDGAETTTGPTGGMSATETGSEATTGGTDGTTGTGGSTSGSTGSTGPATSSGEPLYGVVEPPNSP